MTDKPPTNTPASEPRRSGTRRARGSRSRETYAEEQARLDAEAVDRWAVIVADWPPMTDEQIQGLAIILNRIEERLAKQQKQG